jgi:Flp pilus assembly pilin Flp
MSPRFPPGDMALIAAFIALAILAYVALLGAAGGSFVNAVQNLPSTSQYP